MTDQKEIENLRETMIEFLIMVNGWPLGGEYHTMTEEMAKRLGDEACERVRSNRHKPPKWTNAA